MTEEREEPQLQVGDRGGGMHWRLSNVFFFFPANIQQLKLQQGKHMGCRHVGYAVSHTEVSA